ncbi:MAG: TlyA family RNA methyltransferase [Chloroflexi bacterium]|nr:TlyA family RNA methyltransferase [Chloroflexota bacterium]
MSAKRRLDALMVERSLVPSLEKARAAVLARDVLVEGQPAMRPAAAVAEDVRIELVRPPRYVSRGGEKLEHALRQFDLDVHGLVALDVGASTGGFTDCLLQRGAAKVYAVDVGRGQLHHRLITNPRVLSMERVNAHHPFELLGSSNSGMPVDFCTIDVSFISLTKVIPNAARHLRPGGRLLCLVKPQFEAGRAQVGRGGVVKDPLVHAEALGKVALWSIQRGYRIRGIVPSPIEGEKGNREFFLLLEV